MFQMLRIVEKKKELMNWIQNSIRKRSEWLHYQFRSWRKTEKKQ